MPPTATAVPPTPEPVDEDPGIGETGDDAAEAAPEDAGTGDVEAVAVDGGAIYSRNCVSCHGAEGEGARALAIAGIGAVLAENPTPLTNLVTNGGINMPAFGNRLSAEEIDAVVTWVVENI